MSQSGEDLFFKKYILSTYILHTVWWEKRKSACCSLFIFGPLNWPSPFSLLLHLFFLVSHVLFLIIFGLLFLFSALFLWIHCQFCNPHSLILTILCFCLNDFLLLLCALLFQPLPRSDCQPYKMTTLGPNQRHSADVPSYQPREHHWRKTSSRSIL